MIKAKTDDTIILGLSDENMKRLKNDQPIKFNLKDLGLDLDMNVLIFNGRTEESMYIDLIDLIGPKTKMG